MAFGMAILIGLIFAYVGVKLGFYDMWVVLFNIVISVFLGIFLSPVVAGFAGAAGDYGGVIAVAATAVVAFVILHGITVTFLTRDFNISMLRILDILGSGTLGFLCGFLIWSFVCVVLFISGIFGTNYFKGTDFQTHAEQVSIPYVSLWCDGVNHFAGEKNSKSSETTIKELVIKNKHQKNIETPVIEPNSPANATETAGEPNSKKTSMKPKAKAVKSGKLRPYEDIND